jgi:hypothetical protein
MNSRKKRVEFVRLYLSINHPAPDSCVWHLAFFPIFQLPPLHGLPLVCKKDPKTKKKPCLKISHIHHCS